METYFKIKTFTEFTVPVVFLMLLVLLLVLMILFSAIKCAWNFFKKKKIKKYMLANGYECYLIQVNSSRAKERWAYEKGRVRVDEDDLCRMTFRQIKRKYK